MSARPFLGWRMLGLAFLAQNLAIGLIFGSFGVLMKPVSEELQASRGLASFGIAAILAIMGIAGPLLGWAMRRFGIRDIMSAGAVLMAAGFVLASVAPAFWVFMLGYSGLAGIGCALLGIIPCTTLMTNWFVARLGLAIGIMATPLLVAAVPPTLSLLSAGIGWRGALQAAAGLLVLCIPLLRLVVSRPEDVGQLPLGVEAGDAPAAAAHGAHGAPAEPVESVRAWSNLQLLGSSTFWMIILTAGLTTMGGIVIVSHLVPFATDHGIAPATAALLLSVNGTCSMAGAILWGVAADRLGPQRALGIIGVILACLWGVLLSVPGLPLLIALLTGIGACSGGVHPVFSALLGRVYGRDSFGVALGLSTLMMLPFTVVAAPLAGWIYDVSGSYALAFQVQIGAFAVSALVLLFGMRLR